MMALGHGIYRVFGPVVKKTEFEFVGWDRKVSRQKVTQIRGGITSRSALFDLFVSILDYDCLIFFEGPSFPVSVLPKKCALIVSVNRVSLRIPQSLSISPWAFSNIFLATDRPATDAKNRQMQAEVEHAEALKSGNPPTPSGLGGVGSPVALRTELAT